MSTSRSRQGLLVNRSPRSARHRDADRFDKMTAIGSRLSKQQAVEATGPVRAVGGRPLNGLSVEPDVSAS